LIRIYTERSQWSDLADIQQLQLDYTYDEEKRVTLLQERAQTVWRHLGEVDEARRIFEEIISIDDQKAAAYEPLETLLTEQNNQLALLDLLERKLDAVSFENEQLLQTQKRAIIVAESMGELYRAIDLARRAFEDHDEDQELYATLERLFTSQQSWDDLRDLKEQRLEQVQGADKIKVAKELAILCEQQLGLVDDAVDHLLVVLAEKPDEQDSFVEARRLLIQTMRYDDLIQLLQTHLENQSSLSREESTSYALELAKYAQEEGQQDVAVRALEKVLEQDPENATALSGLAQAYEEDGDWDKATEMLKGALKYAEAGQAKAEALTRLGMIYMDQLDDLSEAKKCFTTSLEEQQNLAAIDALIMFAREDDNEAEVGRLLEMKAPLAEGKDRLNTLNELASYYQQVGKSAEQLEILEQAHREDPNATKIAEKLIERYLEDQRFSEAEPIITRMIGVLQEAGKVKALNRYTYQLGKLKQAQGDLQNAFDLFERCRSNDPTFAPALVSLSQLYVQAERWEEAQELLSSLLLQRQISAQDRVEVFYLNGVTRQAMGDERKAKDMFQRALGVNPNHEQSQTRLQGLNG
jgi:tetratricopeptide (TPR) repeat protein